MTDKTENFGPIGPEDAERRAALIKIGKYVAYTQPMVLATVSAARGQPTRSVSDPDPNCGNYRTRPHPMRATRRNYRTVLRTDTAAKLMR